MKIPNMHFKNLPLVLLFISISAFSEQFCVTNTAELNQALLLSSDNDQDDVIKMEQGTYIVETTGSFGNGFEYYGFNEDFDLEISGGWIEFFNNPCGQQFDDPKSTILDGDGLRRVLNITMGNGDVTLTNFWIFNGYYTGDKNVAGAGLTVELRNGSNSTAKIERMVFSDNYAPQSAALAVSGRGGRVYLKNNLIVSNVSIGNSFVASLTTNGNYAINNTVMFNTGSGISTILSGNSEGKAFFANNILWGNDAFDYRVTGDENTELYLYNNNLGVQFLDLPINTIQSGNKSYIPEFKPGFLNFTPVSGSPMINTGKAAPFIVPIPPPFELAWHYGLLDFEGGDRVNDVKVDIGAFESPIGSLTDLIFANDFE